MNALDLRFEDASFDDIFSSSSLEHFGEHQDVRRSLEEMCRVLKPGGICSISTEFRISGEGKGLPGILMFTEEQVQQAIGDLPWDLMDPLDTSLSEATLATAYPFAEAATDVISHVRTHGYLVFHRLNWRHYPHIVLSEGEYVWTSVHLALRRR